MDEPLRLLITTYFILLLPRILLRLLWQNFTLSPAPSKLQVPALRSATLCKYGDNFEFLGRKCNTCRYKVKEKRSRSAPNRLNDILGVLCSSAAEDTS